jgi:hypothetical protein
MKAKAASDEAAYQPRSNGVFKYFFCEVALLGNYFDHLNCTYRITSNAA